MNGLNFNGKNSKDFGFVMKSENRQLIPEIHRQTVQVTGLHGLVDFEKDTYAPREIMVLLQYIYKNTSMLMQHLEQVGAWLHSDGKYHDLYFDDQPDRVYRAKLGTRVDVSPNNKNIALQVSFICNPPFPYVNGVPLTPEDIIWNTAEPDEGQWIQTFTESGVMRFTNPGTSSVKPVIKLIGYFEEITLECDGQTWHYTAPLVYDGIVIDCDAETVTRMSDGESLFPDVDPSADDYFELPAGQVEIEVTATGIGAFPDSLTIAVEFDGVIA